MWIGYEVVCVLVITEYGETGNCDKHILKAREYVNWACELDLS
jgi:hypothetical protein